MSYFTALVVRLGLYFGGLPLPRQKEGSHEQLYYSEKLGGSCARIIYLPINYLNAFMLLSQCFDAANSML